tara:strand:- start:5 stop:685 length:681 start_codon:yes stop_codon:yes gene_type:complete
MLDGIVYKLCCKDADEFYIGSTIDFHKRQLKHKSCCNNVKGNDYNLKVYKYIRDNGGFDEWNFEILELGEYENKYLLYERERFFIEQNKPSLNHKIPNRTQKEYKKDNKEKINEKTKEYYQRNKEILCKKQKENYDNNKEIICKKAKEYYQKNKERINERAKEHYQEYYQNSKEHKKEYYEKNKEKINERRKEKIKCEVCNCMIMRNSKSGHIQSQKHIRNLNNTG